MSASTVRSSLSAGLAALLVALALWAALARPAAADTSVWTDTSAEENVPVQACAGSEIVTSFTMQRETRFVTGGARFETWEQQSVQFAGTFSNATTDASLAYVGRFLRTTDLDAGTVAISGLWLRLVPPDRQVPVAPLVQVWATADNPSGVIWQRQVRPAEPVEVVAARIAGDLPASPPAIVLEVGPPEITWRLCQLLGDQPLASAATPVGLQDCALVIPRGRPC